MTLQRFGEGFGHFSGDFRFILTSVVFVFGANETNAVAWVRFVQRGRHVEFLLKG